MRTRPSLLSPTLLSSFFAVVSVSAASTSFAQAPPVTNPPAPNLPANNAPVPNSVPTPTPRSGPGSAPVTIGAASVPGTTPATTAIEKPETDLLQVRTNGITADQVARRAALTSNTAKASTEALHAAAVRVDAAWSQFLPRLSGVGRYTRLSNFVPPAISFGSGQLVGTEQPGGTINPTPTQAVSLGPLSFPLVLDNWLLQASINIPISDYFLRISQNYTAATHIQAAARYDVAAARAKSASDGKVTFYTWLRARGATVVAGQALDDQRTHLNDAKNQFTVGNISRADVLRAETAVSAAELQVVRSKNLADLTERQLRIAVHADDSEAFSPGESLDTPPPSINPNLKQLVNEAESARYEIKSIDANAEALRKQATATKNGAYPQLSGFGDAIYANPNQRRFPQSNEWFPTWDLGVQVIWSPNDVITSLSGGAGLQAQAAQLDAQKLTIRDGIELEVTQAYQAALEADQAKSSAIRELASATEAYRVARELFNAGKATSVTLTDAESDLTRARLDELNAKVDAHIARVRLEHALGRDTKAAPNP